jgi:CheY-like chemotaxis protein
MLELFQIHAEEAADGRRAILSAEENAFDLILVDHIMPELNGLKTTAELRRTALNKDTVIIIALTSDVTEKIRHTYLKAKANDIYEKPLELKNLAAMLRTWGLLNQAELFRQSSDDCSGADHELIKSIIETIDDIDYEAGLKYALGNPVNFVNILETSLKDLKSCINIIVHSYENNALNELKMGVHKLKNILVNIGTLKLYDESSVLERVLKDLKPNDTDHMYHIFMCDLGSFEEKLISALDRIHALGMKGSAKQTRCMPSLTTQEYEQSLMNAIYYIRRYEYDSIIKELNKLIDRGWQADKDELQFALSDIRDFDYDAALSRIIRIKNKTDQ